MVKVTPKWLVYYWLRTVPICPLDPNTEMTRKTRFEAHLDGKPSLCATAHGYGHLGESLNGGPQ